MVTGSPRYADADESVAPNTLTPFGEVLRRLRKERDISQAALARNAGVSPGYIGLIETGLRGERPSLDICKKVAQGLKLDVAETEELLRAAGVSVPTRRSSKMTSRASPPS